MFTPDSDITHLPKHFIYADTIRTFLAEKESLLTNRVEWEHVIHTSIELEIDVRFILARTILESNWGKSRIALGKNNCLGWRAFGKDPYKNARTFASWTDCIVCVLHFFRWYYIDQRKLKTIKQIMGRYSTAKDAWSTADLMNQIEAFRVGKEDNV
jgi:beta-N-acetylglucosaminidase